MTTLQIAAAALRLLKPGDRVRYCGWRGPADKGEGTLVAFLRDGHKLAVLSTPPEDWGRKCDGLRVERDFAAGPPRNFWPFRKGGDRVEPLKTSQPIDADELSTALMAVDGGWWRKVRVAWQPRSSDGSRKLEVRFYKGHPPYEHRHEFATLLTEEQATVPSLDVLVARFAAIREP